MIAVGNRNESELMLVTFLWPTFSSLNYIFDKNYYLVIDFCDTNSINTLKRTKKDQWLKFGKLCTTPGQWGLLSGQVQIKDDPHLVNQLEFYVEGPKKSRNYLVDGASLKVSKVPESFYEKANSEIDRLRKVDLTVEAAYPEFSNVTISISQVKHNFPFGSGRFLIQDMLSMRYLCFLYIFLKWGPPSWWSSL